MNSMEIVMQPTNETSEVVLDSLSEQAEPKPIQLTPQQYKKLISAMNAAANKEVKMKNRKAANRRRNKAARKARRINKGK
jgi:hypothetical protein